MCVEEALTVCEGGACEIWHAEERLCGGRIREEVGGSEGTLLRGWESDGADSCLRRQRTSFCCGLGRRAESI